jgi:RNA polymerase sigma-70 factor (ECF subfamily)
VQEKARQLANAHHASLEAFAMKLCRNPSDARDLVQDTFERALKTLQAGETITHERSWLFTVMQNLFFEKKRRAKRRPEAESVDVANDVAAPPRSEQSPAWLDLTRADLDAAVAELDPEFRDAYRMHALEGRSYAEIAGALGIPQNTVGTRLLRARKKLRELLERALPEASRAQGV